MSSLGFIILVLLAIVGVAVNAFEWFFLLHITSFERLFGWHFSNTTIYYNKVAFVASMIMLVVIVSIITFEKERK